jgi:hypothetical protein
MPSRGPDVFLSIVLEELPPLVRELDELVEAELARGTKTSPATS